MNISIDTEKASGEIQTPFLINILKVDTEETYLNIIKTIYNQSTVLEKMDSQEYSPFDCKEIKLVNPKGNQSWIFIGRTDLEAKTPIIWPPDAKSWFIRKDPGPGKDWR